MVPFKGQRGPVEISTHGSAGAGDPTARPPFAFHIPGRTPEIDPAILRIVCETLDAVRSLGSPAEGVREFHVRAQHDQVFAAFAQGFGFATLEPEKLAVLHLFKARPPERSVEDLADALEYVSRYRDVLPASVSCVRFHQSLHFFNPQAAEAFAKVLKVAPGLDPEKVFRNIATEYGIAASYRRIDQARCIAHFNEAEIIEGMEAFAIESYVCVRKKRSAASINYAEAVVSMDEFARFVLCVHTDPRHAVLDIIAKNGARASLCCSLIRCYLQHHDAEEALLVSELLATVRGRPPFVSMPKFLIETQRGVQRGEPVLRLAKTCLPPAHAEGSRPAERPASVSKA